ncbi:SpoIIE family protein phosphatase [Streptomyces sp. B-S-A8]|uniref:SpoIIE family protein phosphatase n=1 Tax=Streptomyces solicavernae TaxID=3043614 RepID=A0ABT6RVD4_9ACTN|nr:SpoIIE family protein phosphatase [Streptomyces sp. B-S-A8]MDI3387698.1 SpoIIE family protein phosphatase [Streptomyces sp. B-S-A8]
MNAADALPPRLDPEDPDPLLEPGGLLDALGVAAVVLDAEGHIALWSPQAENLFGYTAAEALGHPAARLLVDEEHLDLVLSLFTEVMATGEPWAGVFPVRHKEAGTRLAEFRNMRLEDQRGNVYALGLASERATLQRMERDLALSLRLVSQSPIGLAVMDTDLRYVMVNPALERINGISAAEHIGHTVSEALPFLDGESIESAMREVLATGTPALDTFTVGRTPADPETDHAWSVSLHRLEGSGREKVIGLAVSVVDITEQHRAATAAARAQRRLAMIADATERIGTTLDLDRTARELADCLVPEFADIAAVDLLDSVLKFSSPARPPASGGALFRAVAVAAAAHPSFAERASEPAELTSRYESTRLVAQCVRSGRPTLIAHVRQQDLARIGRDRDVSALLEAAGTHSYMAIPLKARGTVLGALTLARTRNPLPFDHDDLMLAGELAARAAVSIDNARGYQQQSHAALSLQRHLLPHRPAKPPGLDIAYRYQPATTAGEVGGDWFDVIRLAGERSALVVGDVMGSGINAAASMGQLRTATRTLAGLGLAPADVLSHLDRIAAELDETLATCVYAEYDPHSGRCRIATAGHLPPVRCRPDERPQLLSLPTGAPLGVGGVPFEAADFDLTDGDELLLYTDGLVETRDEDIGTRLATLIDVLDQPRRSLEETCDLLLTRLRRHGDPDDVAVLIARTHPLPPADGS